MKESSKKRLFLRAPQLRPSKGDAQRLAVLEVALQCLAEKGINALSFQEIARTLRIRRSHIVYYYPTLDALLTDLLKVLLSTGQDITVAHLSSVKSPLDMLTAYVEATFLWFRIFPQHAGVLFLSCHLGAVNSEHRDLLTTMRQSSEERILTILKKQAGRKKRTSAWYVSRASDIRSLIMGNLLNYFTTNQRGTYEALERQTVLAVQDLANAP